MQMSAMDEGNCLVISVEEHRIDASVAVRFKDWMRELTQNTSQQIVLDLSRVESVDSSGLGAIVGAMKQLGREKRLDLAGLTPSVDKVFRMTRMDTVFRIFPDRASAIGGVVHAS